MEYTPAIGMPTPVRNESSSDLISPRLPRRQFSLPLDLIMAAAALALAWWVRVPEAPLSGWLDVRPGAIASLVIPQALVLTLLLRADERGWIGRVIAGAVLGGLLGAAVVWLWQGLDALPRGVAVAQIWLLIVLALGWRSMWILRAMETRPVPTSDLAPPREPLGPLATVRQHRTLLRLLVARDLKLKYRGSLVGFFWSLANPLVMTATYTVAFTYIFPNRVEGFIFLLLIGILAWTFFAGSAGMSTGAIVDSGSLVKSIYFPRAILPLATVIFNLVQYLLALAVLLPAMFLLYRIVPGWPVLLLPVILILLAAFTLGIAMLMAASTAVFRDVRHLLDITLQVLFWATPILYHPSTYSAPVRAMLQLSPLAPFIESARAMLYYGQMPAPHLWVLALLYATSSLCLGLAVFTRYEDRFAESV
jgi:ABC-type polysaccharide/polyol phosphate export permease